MGNVKGTSKLRSLLFASLWVSCVWGPGVLSCDNTSGLNSDSFPYRNHTTHLAMKISASMQEIAGEFAPNKNLTAVKWAHAVNTREKVVKAMNDPNVDMIEADVMIDNFFEGSHLYAVLGHPPSTYYDIDLAQFLKYCLEANKAGKGIKLDFKSIEAFESSLDVLHKYMPQVTFPVWLNADILYGPRTEPGISTVQPVDAKRFLNNCVMFPNAVLSIGWTTEWGEQPLTDPYEWAHIQAMISAITMDTDLKHTKQKITFPVRAGPAAITIGPFEELLQVVSSMGHPATLTVWSAPKDHVDVPSLLNFIDYFGVDRVFLDVPEELQQQLKDQLARMTPKERPVTSGKKALAPPYWMGLSMLMASVTMLGIVLHRKGCFQPIEKAFAQYFHF